MLEVYQGIQTYKPRIISLYTSMSYTQINLYYLIFHNELFVNNLISSN
jgi:hypothetical protein